MNAICAICGRQLYSSMGCQNCPGKYHQQSQYHYPAGNYPQQSPAMNLTEISLNEIVKRLERIEAAITSLKISKAQE